MPQKNQLSRYGAISRVIPDLSPGAKVFFVHDSDDTTVGVENLANVFPVDEDGVVRVYNTIQAAVNAASAGRGDVVLVSPNYDHTLGRADSWATAGVHVVGLGSNNSFPIVRYGGIADEVGVAANNVHVKNLVFLADFDSIARAVDLDTGFSGAHIENCWFDFDSNAQNFKTMVRVGQANSIIENNQFWAEDTAGAGKGVEFLGGYADYTKVKDNFFYGQFDTVGDSINNAGAIAIAIDHDSGDTVLSGVEITGNTIVSTDTAAALLINMAATAISPIRGIVKDNKLATYDTATADTAQVAFGGLLPLNNTMITGDSDVQQSIVGTRLMRGVLDSG